MITCQFCGKEINPICISNYNLANKTKYHEGCKIKANRALRKKKKFDIIGL